MEGRVEKTARVPVRKRMRVTDLKALFGLTDVWDLCAMPISYDGSVAFIFRDKRQDDIDFSDVDTAVYQYKVILLDSFDGNVLMRFDLECRGLALVMVCFYENGYVIILRDSKDAYFARRYNMENHMMIHYSLGYCACRVAVTKDGHVAAGYWLDVGDSLPRVRIFDQEGRARFSFQDQISRKCSDITTDERGDIWFHCMPNSRIYRVSIEKNKIHVTQYNVPIAGEEGIAVFRDGDQESFVLETDSEQMGVMLYLCSNNFSGKCLIDSVPMKQIATASFSGRFMIFLSKDEEEAEDEDASEEIIFCDASDAVVME